MDIVIGANILLNESATVKTDKAGRDSISVKCPSLTAYSEKEASALEKKMLRLLGKESVQFTGADISKVFTDDVTGNYRIYGTYYFLGGDGEVYGWTGSDTENPRGFNVVITKFGDAAKDKPLLKAEIVSKPSAPEVKAPPQAVDVELKQIVAGFVKSAGTGELAYSKEGDSFIIRSKFLSKTKIKKTVADSGNWDSAPKSLATEYEYADAYTLKSDATVVLCVDGAYGRILRKNG